MIVLAVLLPPLHQLFPAVLYARRPWLSQCAPGKHTPSTPLPIPAASDIHRIRTRSQKFILKMIFKIIYSHDIVKPSSS